MVVPAREPTTECRRISWHSPGKTPIAVDRSTMIGRVALDGKTVHIHDVMNDPDYTSGFRQFGEYRTAWGYPC